MATKPVHVTHLFNGTRIPKWEAGFVDPTVLHPAPLNANVMESEQFDVLVRAIRERGFLQPVLVRELQDSDGDVTGLYEIIDGHHRVRAAAEVGLPTIPYCNVGPVDDATAIGLALSMNRIRGEVNLTDAASLLASLAEAGWNDAELSLTGFSPAEAHALLESLQPEPELPPMDPAGLPETNEDGGMPVDEAGPFFLELSFPTKELMNKAKRGLRKAAGRGNPIERGLYRLLEIDVEG